MPRDNSNLVDQYLYRPARAARVTLEEVQRIQDQSYRLSWGIPIVDNYVMPMLGGDLIAVVGRPGMGKTTALLHLARQATIQLAAIEDPGVVLYATWETLVEETVAVFSASSGVGLSDIGRGRADMQSFETAVMDLVSQNLAIFGRSKTTTREAGQSVASTRVHNLDDLDQALVHLRQIGKPVRFLVIDYLQRIPGIPGQDRQGRATENLERVKDMTLVHDLPTAMAVQARREVDEYGGLKMPGLSDGQWTSNIEQSSDKIVGVTRPWAYLAGEGKPIKSQVDEGLEWAVTPTTICIKVIKQRWSDAGRTFVLSVDFETLSLSEQPPSEVPF